MKFTESNIEEQIKRVVRFYEESDIRLKLACLSAAPIVGAYDGTSALIAHELSRSPSTIENWADAGKLYLELRKKEVTRLKLVRQLWKTLPASHWWLARAIQKKGYRALEYLYKAYQHKWSGQKMMEEYKSDMESGNAPMQMDRAVLAFRTLAWELTQQETMFDNKQQAALAAVREAFP